MRCQRLIAKTSTRDPTAATISPPKATSQTPSTPQTPVTGE